MTRFQQVPSPFSVDQGDDAKTGAESYEAMTDSNRAAHLLLQVRVQTLNEDLRDTFCQWYPGMTREAENLLKAA